MRFANQLLKPAQQRLANLPLVSAVVLPGGNTSVRRALGSNLLCATYAR